MSKKFKIKVIGKIENEHVYVIIPLWFFQIISNYQIINADNEIFGNRMNGICFIKDKKK